jgi:hypothetical protein
MATFRDADNREWKLRLTVGLLGDVKRDADVDLGAAIKTPQSMAEILYADPANLVRVLWVMVEKQAREAGVTPEEFGHAFDGEAIERAGEALLEAVADFFPRSAIARKIRSELPKLLEAADREMIAKLEAVTNSTSSGSGGNSGESSGSTPGPTPSAN